MTKRNIEIDDVLPDCVAGAIDEVERELRDYINENKPDEVPCISNDLDYSGAIHEIIDGAVPIYTAQIEAAWFLHGRALEEAYENAGIGTGKNPRENNGMVAIYCYIDEMVREWYANNAERIFEEMTSKD
jgi:hypothetical protein